MQNIILSATAKLVIFSELCKLFGKKLHLSVTLHPETSGNSSPHPLYLVNPINCPHVINLRDINNNQNQRPEDNSHKGRYGG